MALSMVDKGGKGFRLWTYIEMLKNRVLTRSAHNGSLDTGRRFLYSARVVRFLVLP